MGLLKCRGPKVMTEMFSGPKIDETF